MIRFIVTLAVLIALIYLGATVKIGKHTFFGHVRAIWHTEQVQDLKDGVKEKTGPAVDRVKRGIEAGYNAMKDDGGPSAPASGSAAPAPASP
ncbi:MAG: hypothetical protein JWO36_2717 [Myxococcales bacterium]|nr:hypothetical protein [Myxococcales bacterium]